MSSPPNDLINVSIRDEALKIMPRSLFNCPVEEKIKLNSEYVLFEKKMSDVPGVLDGSGEVDTLTSGELNVRKKLRSRPV